MVVPNNNQNNDHTNKNNNNIMIHLFSFSKIQTTIIQTSTGTNNISSDVFSVPGGNIGTKANTTANDNDIVTAITTNT